MNEHIDAWISDLVIGTLDGATRAAVEAHLEECDRCAGEVVAATEALTSVAMSLPPERPHPSVFTNVLASIAEQEPRPEGGTASDRFADLVDRLVELFDLTRERVSTLLELVDEPAAWRRGAADGITLIDFQGGARIAAADAGFVRVAPGVTFPHHRHVGGEVVLVLEGGLVDEDGTVVRRGEAQEFAAGTSHFFVALAEGCVFAAVIWDGLDFAAPSTSSGASPCR
ncbi:MAG TPA: cupin domain-containing protein [Kofleriaceae bacterium]|nr:cupin domain-containing protein [Kofleriaceae bacterium]